METVTSTGRAARGDSDDLVPSRVAARALAQAGGESLRPLRAGARLAVLDDDGTKDRGLVLERRARAAGADVATSGSGAASTRRGSPRDPRSTRSS